MNGRRLKFPNIIDEFSHVGLAIRVGGSCKGVDVITAVEELLGQHPASTHLRMDNGPEFMAHALQEWCTGSGSGTEDIPPGSPWENLFVKSFNGKFRDEFLNIKLFASLAVAKVLAGQHRIEYNVYKPHAALRGSALSEVLQQWEAARSPNSSHRDWNNNGGGSHVTGLCPIYPDIAGRRDDLGKQYYVGASLNWRCAPSKCMPMGSWILGLV